MNQHISLLLAASLAEMPRPDIADEDRHSRIAVRQDGHVDALERSSQGADHRLRCRWRRPEMEPTSTGGVRRPAAGASAGTGTFVTGVHAVCAIMSVGATMAAWRGPARG
jgi:hypothetical protein